MSKLFEKAAASGSETEEVKHSRRELESKVKSLEYELEFQASEFEKKVRSMRQEHEHVKAIYEGKISKTPDAQ